MPQITEYDAGNVGLNPTETGINAVANAGRRIGSLYSEAGNEIGAGVKTIGQTVERFQANREISQGSAEYAKTMSGLDQKWNEIAKNADPNDPSIAAKFRETQVEPVLEKLRESFGTAAGKSFSESQTEKLRNHFFSKTASDMSTLAGVAARNNLLTLTNELSNAAITDPSSVKTSLSLIEGSVKSIVESNPNLTPVDAARIKAEVLQQSQSAVVRAAAIGAIGINPEAGLKKFSSPEYSKYLSGAELRQLEQQAKTVERARRVDENYALQNQKLMRQEASEAREGEYLTRIYSGDPKEASKVSTREIANDFTLSREARERMIGIVERQLKPETDSRLSQQTFVGLLRDMRDPNTDPEKLMEKAWDARLMDPGKPGSLSERDFNQLRAEIVARKTPEGAALERDRNQFFKQYAGAIAGRAYDPVVGSPKLYAAEVDARRMEADLRKKGLDPHLAYDPSSEYFLGKPSRLGKYSGSMQGDLEVKATAPAAEKEAGLPPPSLRGIASLSFSKTRNLYRDDTTGKIYRPDGTEVTK